MKPAIIQTKTIRQEFEKFILENDHPCIMARTIFAENSLCFHTYSGFGGADIAGSILNDLGSYLSKYSFDDLDFRTFIAAFPEEDQLSDKQFEERLWSQLQYLHAQDPQPWDPGVSSDPEDAHFSFSVHGHAFYIVGMHPGSTRRARRSPCPAMVFNLHHQFEQLREMGTYERIRDTIRERDRAWQGTVNPMLEDFGQASEARQYSGRETGEHWKCPFQKMNKHKHE